MNEEIARLHLNVLPFYTELNVRENGRKFYANRKRKQLSDEVFEATTSKLSKVYDTPLKKIQFVRSIYKKLRIGFGEL